MLCLPDDVVVFSGTIGDVSTVWSVWSCESGVTICPGLPPDVVVTGGVPRSRVT